MAGNPFGDNAMNGRKAISQLWRERGITVKFTAAFGALLALIVLIAIGSIVALTFVRRETETAIVTSTEIQRLVLEMDGGLQEARGLEKDFFWRYPTLGYSVAYQTYAQPADEQITQVRALSAELQQLVSESDVSDAWRESDVNLNLYLSAASRHAATVEEAAELVARLAADETGLQAQLAHSSSLLQDTLQMADDPGLMILYHEMQSFEKEYLITRRRPLMQSAFNTAVPLREAIELAPTLEADQKTQSLTYLDNYLAIAKEILELDVAIGSKFNEFDLQAEAVDPISEELIALADQEVERARAQIDQTGQSVRGILVATALVGLALAGMIARVLNNSITRNVVKLTKVAGELQAGNLEVRARIDSADELGQLADSFNTMATRLSSLVGSLEQKVAERTAELTTANERLQSEITERKRAEEARERLLAELEAKNKELESFVYTVSHDLKAPLVSLDGFSAALQKEFYDQLGGQGQHYLERIQANVAHMDTLIVDLLELSRIGRVIGSIEEIDVVAMLRAIQEELAVELEEAGAEFVVQEPLSAVRADRGRIRQVFANLIDNAVKFRSAERPLRVEVGCQEERSFCRFHVADNGIGIASQYQEQIFAPFRQLDAKTEGVGMGLALVKKIVEHHGGRIWVESESGKGSTFYFTLRMRNGEFGMRNDSEFQNPHSTFQNPHSR